MADYDNRLARSAGGTSGVLIDDGLRSHMLRIYNYMLVGLLLTGGTAWLVSSSPQVAALFFQVNAATNAVGLSALGWVALLAPLAMVFFLSFGINRMSVGAAQALFWVYSGVVGIGLAPILWIYTGASVAETFFITAATFGAMSVWGYTTRANLAGMGSFLFMGLIGIIIASVVNMFLHSAAIQWVVSVAGVLIFTGLTAYDTQAIKESYVANDDGTVAGRKAIFGALRLYLDFLNLFLLLLQLFGGGNRR